ncbi:Piso0_000105 [Millerozyma farinosa CBS 7064]|uniref:Piso0_000105 protein n=1 Tax=Pichia sorbitophila (strain ATCC MYA-4447 / BCRC 22081 / CBS 7064 / NBRC 10061 / NRRL Y-12695) TaxID=559304 RepID=G8YT37_PICSO|nr:Piso0_000105 [Millerozyma farinosa CBS 7064]
MTRGNRREDIEKKEALQARLKVAFSLTNDKVTGWLNKNKGGDESASHKATNNDYLNLPIIKNGQGLEFDNKPLTVGDFMNSDIRQMNKLDKNPQRRGADNKIVKGDSKPMSALMNKIRKDSRDTAKKRIGNSKERHMNPSSPVEKKSIDANVETNESDESDDEALLNKSRTAKKGSNLLFETKLKSSK